MHYHHYYEVIRLAATEQLTVVPVLDDKETTWAASPFDIIATMMADMASVKQPGGIIVLEVSDQELFPG
jgi:acetoin utilization protein AcuB